MYSWILFSSYYNNYDTKSERIYIYILVYKYTHTYSYTYTYTYANTHKIYIIHTESRVCVTITLKLDPARSCVMFFRLLWLVISGTFGEA